MGLKSDKLDEVSVRYMHMDPQSFSRRPAGDHRICELQGAVRSRHILLHFFCSILCTWISGCSMYTTTAPFDNVHYYTLTYL